MDVWSSSRAAGGHAREFTSAKSSGQGKAVGKEASPCIPTACPCIPSSFPDSSLGLGRAAERSSATAGPYAAAGDDDDDDVEEEEETLNEWTARGHPRVGAAMGGAGKAAGEEALRRR